METENHRSGTEFTKKFGVGISLYMKMLKLFMVTYVVMGVIQLPALVCNIVGLGEGEAADLSMVRLLEARSEATSGGVRRTCERMKGGGQDGGLQRRTAGRRAAAYGLSLFKKRHLYN